MHSSLIAMNVLVDENELRKEKLPLEHRYGDWESNCKRTMQTSKQKYQRKAPIIVCPYMTEKRKNKKVYYNWPVGQTNQVRVKMLFFKNETEHWWPHTFKQTFVIPLWKVTSFWKLLRCSFSLEDCVGLFKLKCLAFDIALFVLWKICTGNVRRAHDNNCIIDHVRC